MNNINITNFQGIITDDVMLYDICEVFAKSQYIALDTEYMREATYYPQPSLVQISDGKNHAILDIIALQDLQPLKRLLATPKITKIIHSYEQDLMVLKYIGCPIKHSLFDTQLAAAFLGFGYMVGYQTLVETCLGVKLKKGYARSNWLTRPLAKEQIKYAIEDVIHLPKLYHFLNKHLQASGKASWCEEDSKRILNDYYSERVRRPTPKVSGEGQLTTIYEKHRLRKLVEWREEKAKTANMPRRWLVKDKYLIAVAQNRMSLDELINIHKDNLENEYIDKLSEQLKLIKYETQNSKYISAKDKQLIEKLKQLISQAAQDHGVEKSLIASHKQISRYVRDEKNRASMALSSGWRYRMINQPIKKLLAAGDG